MRSFTIKINSLSKRVIDKIDSEKIIQLTIYD